MSTSKTPSCSRCRKRAREPDCAPNSVLAHICHPSCQPPCELERFDGSACFRSEASSSPHSPGFTNTKSDRCNPDITKTRRATHRARQARQTAMRSVQCKASPPWSHRATGGQGPSVTRWHNIVQRTQTERTNRAVTSQLVQEGAWRRRGASGWCEMAPWPPRNAPQRLRAVGIVRVSRIPRRSPVAMWVHKAARIKGHVRQKTSPWAARRWESFGCHIEALETRPT